MNPTGITCPRCKREVSPWPLRRGDHCSAKYWAYCIRPVEAVIADVKRREEKKVGR